MGGVGPDIHDGFPTRLHAQASSGVKSWQALGTQPPIYHDGADDCTEHVQRRSSRPGQPDERDGVEDQVQTVGKGVSQGAELAPARISAPGRSDWQAQSHAAAAECQLFRADRVAGLGRAEPAEDVHRSQDDRVAQADVSR